MKSMITLASIFLLMGAQAQTSLLRVNSHIILPKDSIERNTLITALNDFLDAARKPNEENKFVFEPEQLETFIELDEVRGMEKNTKRKDDFFYKPYLTNVVLQQDSNYFVQISYIGLLDSTPILRASVEFIAHRVNQSFMFSSMLVSNTKEWFVEKSDQNIFHYRNTINKKKVKEYNRLTTLFDEKLKSIDKITDHYCCDNLIEMEKLIGVTYESDYNGRRESVWGTSLGNRKLIVFGNSNSSFDEFDPHDLFHSRLAIVIARSKVNKPVDEGCAYLYGGSWGFTWKEIFKAFKEQVATSRNIDWVEVKEKSVSFTTGKYTNSADYIINALLVKKIESEKGFEGVWELLNVGPVEKGNETYYQVLEKLTGITKANYTNKVWELIDEEE